MFHRKRPTPEPRFMNAKKAGTCPETGKTINVGDEIAWNPSSGKAFHTQSPSACSLLALQFAQSWNMADANY